MTHADAFESEEELLAALGELESLSKFPRPQVDQWPPWERIRAILPPNCELPSTAVNVLVDLSIDSSGLITRAAVGHLPARLINSRIVAVCIDSDGTKVVQRPLPEAPPQLAQAVAAAHVGERFEPGERNGVPVAVRLLRVGVGIPPGTLQHNSAL